MADEARAADRPVTGERVLFDCPVCGARYDGHDLRTGMEADLVELNPGDPDLRHARVMAAGERWFTTSACSCKFSMRLYDIDIARHPGPPPMTRLFVIPKGVSQR